MYKRQGYNTGADKVEAYLLDVWKTACKLTAAINPDREGVIRLIENGDNAVTRRLLYTLTAEHEIINARNAVKQAAFELQKTHGVQLATPLTHTFPGGAPPAQ